MKKKFKTSEEGSSGKNIKSINIKNLTESKNKELIKKAKIGKLPGYHVVKIKNKEEFLRSNPDRKRKNNLDPIIRKKQ